MSFLEHLVELRTRIIQALIGIAVWGDHRPLDLE